MFDKKKNGIKLKWDKNTYQIAFYSRNIRPSYNSPLPD